MGIMKLAVIDIGTNTIILLIAEGHPDKTFSILHDECQIARLGEGIHYHKHFLPEAMDRAFQVLKNYKTTIDYHVCDDVIVVGTAAFRNALNSADFIKRVSDELQLHIKMITGEEEAKLIHACCLKDFPDLPRPTLVLDIGGGSTEIIYHNQDSIQAISFPFGAVKLTEQFFHSDPPEKKEINELIQFIKKEIFGRDPAFTQIYRPTLIATAGTPTTLKAISLGLSEYDPAKVHATKMTRNELIKLMARLQALPLKERMKINCLPEKRADVILAGSYILKEILEHLNLEDFWISDRGLRFGVLYTHMK